MEHATPSSQSVPGLDLAEISQELRAQYNIKNSVKGVVVTNVESSSEAAKSIKPGDIITGDSVTTPANAQKRIEDRKKVGKLSALLLVSNSSGELRFVALDLLR
jgi:serine protease Do